MLTRKLAEFVTGTKTADLPEEALERARAAFVDTLGTTLAGLPDETAVIARAYVEELGAKPVSTVFGTATRTAPAEAAFVNGVTAHVLDFDDSLPTLRGHPSATLVPAALAVGEAVNASGREVLAAYVLGLEVSGAVGQAMGHQHYLKGWHSTATCGVFGATTVAARLWGLNAEQLAIAWGIAASETAGLIRNFGTMTKSFHAGHAARSGVMAAWLAKSGFTADPEIFDGEHGVLSVYGQGDGVAMEEVVKTLGAPWEIMEPGIYVKGWPCCYCNHRPLGGLLQMLDEKIFDPAQVEEVAVGFAPGSDRALIKDNPQTGLEAKFSIEYSVAAALLDGKVGLDSYTDEAVNRPEIRALMKRVRRYQVPMEGIFSGIAGFTDLKVTAGGKTHEMRIDRVPGSPAWPMSTERRREKFLDCASRELGQDAAQAVLDTLDRFLDLSDVGALAEVAQAGSAPGERRRAAGGRG